VWLRRAARVTVMFHLTCVGWLLFRADSFGTVVQYLALLGSSFHVTEAAVAAFALVGFYCAAMFFLEWALDGERRVRRLLTGPRAAQAAVFGYLALMVYFFQAEQAQEFIYFQF
jgi:hypothetical protein